MLDGGGYGRPGGEATGEAREIAAERGFTWAGVATAEARAYNATVVTVDGKVRP